MSSVGIVGGWGCIGRALTEGILAHRIVAPGNLLISGRSSRPADLPAAVRYTSDNAQLARESDLVILSVRPQQLPAVTLDAANRLLVSVMAGVPAAALARTMNTQRIIRAMPSGAVNIGRSYTPMYATPEVSPADVLRIRGIFDTVGHTAEVHSEAHLDYMSGLTGSGAGFVALLAQAMLSHAIARGLDPQLAQRAVLMTVQAAGEQLGRGESSPQEIIESLRAYRGTTAAAFEAMESAGFIAAVQAGLTAAERRVQTLNPFS